MGHRRNASFEDEWPRLARELSMMLRGRKVPDWLADDVVQETGIKLWRMWDEVDPDRPVAGLGKAVAINVLRDHWRHTSRREVPTSEVPERAVAVDVEREGLARAELKAVGRALRKLQPSYRRVLLAEVGLADRAPGIASGATRMLRLRARRELALLVDRASGFGVVLGHRFSGIVNDVARRLAEALGPRDSEGLAWAAAGVLVVVAAGGVLLPGDAPGGRRDDPTDVALVAGVGGAGDVYGSAGVPGVDEMAAETVQTADDLVPKRKNLPMAEARVGELAELGAQGDVEALGVRIGTANDGSPWVGCSDGTETGVTGVGDCDVGKGRPRAAAEVRYRLGDKRGRVRTAP